MSHKTRSAERIIAMLLSLVMLVGLLPMSVFAADVQEQTAQTQQAPDSCAKSEGFAFGPAQTVLEPGRYNLPIKMMNASKPDKESMAAAAIQGGMLEVMEDGSAFVTLKLGPVKMMGLTGWSESWKIYNEYNAESATTPAEVVARDDEGHETEVRFQLPFTDKDGVYANMSVNVGMSMSPDALLKMNFVQAQPLDKLQAPAITPAAGEYTDRVEVTISAARGAEIFYTTDGTEPTAQSDKYTQPIVLTESATVKAVAVKDGKTSAVAQAAYTVKPAGPVVKTGVAPVTEFGYNVTAEVTVEDNTIQSVALSDNAEEMGKLDSLDYIKIASFNMKDKFNGLKADDKAAIEGVDAVAKATITAESYKTAVLKALDLYTPPKAPDFTFGSADTQLEPGTYTVPVSLRNADKHENPSNAVSAFAPNATLIVDEDSIATLILDMQPVVIGPITDMAHSIKIYQEDNYSSATVDARVLDTAVKPENMPNPGIKVPTRISFVLPDNNFDGVYMNFTVDAMGPAYPDGWLSLNFAAAHVPGEAQHKFGEAQVDQFGKYTIHTDVTVMDGIITNVDVTADNFISVTHKPENDVRIDQVTKALKSAWNGMAPTQENAEKIFKVIMKENDPDEVIDSVTGATYSAKAVRDAVMSAFGLAYEDEVINVPESVEPGVYEVPISYYSDVVWHSLVETRKATAVLTVNADRTMSLDIETKSGTDKEPLYILGFNGVYPNNDKTQELTMEGCKAVMGLSSNDYEDEFFAKGTQVVNHVTFPLLGGLDKIYTTNCSLYVPAMNQLNGELSGIRFENGKFDADVFAKIFWDDMKKIEEVPGGSVADGQYTADVIMNQDGKDAPSMSAALFGPKADITVKDGQANLKLYVAYPIPKYPEEGKDGTLKNFRVLFNGREYEAQSDITSKPTFVAEISNEMFGMVKGREYEAQVLTLELPAAALEADKLDASAFVNAVMKNDVDFDMVLSHLTKTEIKGQIEDGNYYVNVSMYHSTKEQPSMGDTAFDNNRQVLVTVENGNVVSVQVASNPVAMGPILSAVTKVEIVLNSDRDPVETMPVEVLTSEKLAIQPAGAVVNYIKTFRFDMPEQYRPETLSGIGYVPVRFVVPGTPMGNDPIDARMRLEWDTAEKTEDTVLKGNSEIPSDVIQLDLTDKASGVKLNGRSDQIPANAKLSVFKPVSGADYNTAAAVMKEEGVTGWELFQINAQVGGQFVQPVSGSVKVSIPCTDKGLTVYRIETDDMGSYAVEVKGKVENGYFVINPKALGSFVVVGAPSVLDQFSDIPAGHWGRPFIEKAVGLDLMKGNAGTFNPDQKMTRAMFVTVLGNLAGVKNTDSGKTGFSDVPEDAWYAPYVAWAVANGVTSKDGVGGGKFAPDATITRQEMAVFMVSYCKYAGIELEQVKTVSFKDEASIDGWAKAAVKAVTGAGLLGDTGAGNFSPKASATRAQAATLLVNFVEKYPGK